MRTTIYALVGLAAVGFALFAFVDTAEATHYRYGTLQWAPTANPNEVLFTGAQAWRASAFGSPIVGDIVSGEGSISPGDGTSLTFYLKVVSTNPINDWFFASFVDQAGNVGVRHTYPCGAARRPSRFTSRKGCRKSQACHACRAGCCTSVRQARMILNRQAS